MAAGERRGEVEGANALSSITDELLCDSVLEDVIVCTPEDRASRVLPTSYIEVSPLPGVTDSVGETLLKRAQKLAGVSISRCATGIRYSVDGCDNKDELARFARQYLANEVVDQWSVNAPRWERGRRPAHMK